MERDPRYKVLRSPTGGYSVTDTDRQDEYGWSRLTEEVAHWVVLLAEEKYDLLAGDPDEERRRSTALWYAVAFFTGELDEYRRTTEDQVFA